MNWNMPPAKGIVTGDLSSHKVARVLITGAGVNAPGWTLYAEIQMGWPVGMGLAVTDWDPSRPIDYTDGNGALQQLVEGQIWRGGAHAAVPNGAVVLLPPTGYTPSHEGPTLIPPRRSAWGLTDAERAALAAQPEPKSSQLQDVFPNLWTSPRRLSLVEEAHALALADDPPSGAVCCGVRAVHGGWVYTTGKAASLHNWGTCKLKEDAQLLATARMHAAWLEWHDLVLEAAGGRTDWLGGIRRPEDGMEYDLGADGDTWKPWGAPGQSTGERL